MEFLVAGLIAEKTLSTAFKDSFSNKLILKPNLKVFCSLEKLLTQSMIVLTAILSV